MFVNKREKNKYVNNPEVSRVKVFFLPTLHKRDAYSERGAYASFHFGDCQWTCKTFGKRPTCFGR